MRFFLENANLGLKMKILKLPQYRPSGLHFIRFELIFDGCEHQHFQIIKSVFQREKQRLGQLMNIGVEQPSTIKDKIRDLEAQVC